MDPLTDCPICFESYEPEPTDEEPCPEPVGRHWPVKLDCCHQSLCCHCQQCLARCPFCRIQWHPEEDVWDEGEHFWQRRRFPNPILTVWGTTLAFDAMRFVAPGVRMAVATAAATVAESSPFVLATGAAGAVAVAGGLALMKASEHRPDMAQRLRRQVSERPRRQLAPPVPERGAKGAAAVVRIWDALQWQLSPQWPGMPHVYLGGVTIHGRACAKIRWRVHGFSLALRSPGEAPPEQLGLTALLSEAEPSSSSRDDQLVLGRRFWGDLVFLFLLWLLGSVWWKGALGLEALQGGSFGVLPVGFQSAYSELGFKPLVRLAPDASLLAQPLDLRHVVSDFARYLCSDHIKAALPEKEWSQVAWPGVLVQGRASNGATRPAFGAETVNNLVLRSFAPAACLIAMLDHLLSWEARAAELVAQLGP
ncbi:Fucoxanthin-chlorophyll a-c binding protein C [Durusdinium trenchii]|uniref:Chloroplastic n=1 Tax=Durusdinium trenchii TaxID=1381693 RepID=A0ABP0KA77_9DINO